MRLGCGGNPPFLPVSVVGCTLHVLTLLPVVMHLDRIQAVIDRREIQIVLGYELRVGPRLIGIEDRFRLAQNLEAVLPPTLPRQHHCCACVPPTTRDYPEPQNLNPNPRCMATPWHTSDRGGLRGREPCPRPCASAYGPCCACQSAPYHAASLQCRPETLRQAPARSCAESATPGNILFGSGCGE